MDEMEPNNLFPEHTKHGSPVGVIHSPISDSKRLPIYKIDDRSSTSSETGSRNLDPQNVVSNSAESPQSQTYRFGDRRVGGDDVLKASYQTDDPTRMWSLRGHVAGTLSPSRILARVTLQERGIQEPTYSYERESAPRQVEVMHHYEPVREQVVHHYEPVRAPVYEPIRQIVHQYEPVSSVSYLPSSGVLEHRPLDYNRVATEVRPRSPMQERRLADTGRHDHSLLDWFDDSTRIGSLPHSTMQVVSAPSPMPTPLYTSYSAMYVREEQSPQILYSSAPPVHKEREKDVMGYRIIEEIKYPTPVRKGEEFKVVKTEGPFTMEEFRDKFKLISKEPSVVKEVHTGPREMGQDATTFVMDVPVPRQVVKHVEVRREPVRQQVQLSTIHVPTSRVSYKSVDMNRHEIGTFGHTPLRSSVPRSDSPLGYRAHDHTLYRAQDDTLYNTSFVGYSQPRSSAYGNLYTTHYSSSSSYYLDTAPRSSSFYYSPPNRVHVVTASPPPASFSRGYSAVNRSGMLFQDTVV